MITSKKELAEKLAKAKSRVQIIGVVPLEADWEHLAQAWAQRSNQSPQFQVDVLCESENMLFTKALTTDSEFATRRRTFQELKFIRDLCLELPQFLVNARTPHHLHSDHHTFSLRMIHLAIPVCVVRIDDDIFANLWLHELGDDYEEIEPTHAWHSGLIGYMDSYFDNNHGGKYASEPDAELLELFDHKRTPRGIFPRSSFYDTDYSQLVVWALVFDRQGRMLIHRRADNAKDNQGMWDKSVGGHVDFSMDVDTSRGVLREVIEELFSDEVKEKSDFFTAWSVTDEEVVYLGEWRPKQRKRYPFEEISAFRREWAFFRLRDSQQLYSPRTMPNGKSRRLRVISDVFLFVAGPGFTEESLGKLKNSEFKLMSLPELKSVMDRALRDEIVPHFDEKNPVPKFSPDLTNIMTGELRDMLEEFSQYVKSYTKD
jgi:hypothetical protein